MKERDQLPVASGTCGENLKWALDEEGTLEIAGTGTVKYDDPVGTWADYRDNINRVVIGEGITDIGGYAFFCCGNLSSIVFPEGVTTIGEYAFWGCEKLSSITLPESVTDIGVMAFCDCKSLSSIMLPEGVTGIGACAFCGCESLNSITLPESVTGIGMGAFENCHCTVCYAGTKEQWDSIYSGGNDMLEVRFCDTEG